MIITYLTEEDLVYLPMNTSLTILWGDHFFPVGLKVSYGVA